MSQRALGLGKKPACLGGDRRAAAKSIVRVLVCAILCLCCVCFFLLSAKAQEEQEVYVYPDPIELEVGEGEIASLAVVIEDGQEVFSIDLRATFDPAVIEVIDADPTKDGVQVSPGTLPPPDTVTRNSVDNATGTIRYTAAKKVTTSAGSSVGAAFSLQVRGKEAGQESWFIIELAEIKNRQGYPFAVLIDSGLISVVEPSAQPATATPSPTATATAKPTLTATATATATTMGATPLPEVTAAPTPEAPHTPTAAAVQPTATQPTSPLPTATQPGSPLASPTPTQAAPIPTPTPTRTELPTPPLPTSPPVSPVVSTPAAGKASATATPSSVPASPTGAASVTRQTPLVPALSPVAVGPLPLPPAPSNDKGGGALGTRLATVLGGVMIVAGVLLLAGSVAVVVRWLRRG